jgi:hypothetical protein
MRRTVTALACTALIALQGASLAGAAAPERARPVKRVITKTVSGASAEADRRGTVTITLKVRKTTITTGTKKTVSRKTSTSAATTPTTPTARRTRATPSRSPCSRRSSR